MDLLSSNQQVVVNSLEVEPEDQLDQTAAGIIRSRNVLVGCCVTSESSGAKTARGVNVVSGGANEEVDVVKGVQEFSAHLEVHSLGEVNLLDYAQV